MPMFIAGQWREAANSFEIRNPFNGQVIDHAPAAEAGDVEAAIVGAAQGARDIRGLTGFERSRILRRAAELVVERQESLGRLISSEEGKTLTEGRAEALRASETLELSGEEAKRLAGETLPLDGASNGAGKLGFTLRSPLGVVAAITPFNFPLNLVCHKVGPALAAGNAVIIKPASDTPLSALALTKILLEAGLPPLAIACVTGSGKTVGDALARDSRVQKISFTGSREVGAHITQLAGVKRITLELGSNCPLIVMDDADLEQVVQATIVSGFGNAGQVCVSAQRVIVARKSYGDYLDALRPKVASIATGDQLAPGTQMGPMIRESDAVRVSQWIDEARAGGARVLVGGGHEGAVHAPTIVADVTPQMRIFREELFGPAVAVSPADDLAAAIALANDTPYGLGASIFTRDIGRAMRFAREVEAGNLHINAGPSWRADLMPYGGLKQSGVGREGVRYAVEEMTAWKTVVFHGV